MRVPDRQLALMIKNRKDGSALCNASLSFRCVLDSLLTEASDRMMLKICRRGLVLRILIVLNTTNSSLALPSGAQEEVAHAAIMILNRDPIGLEEAVYWGVPNLFQRLCNACHEFKSGLKLINKRTKVLFWINLHNLDIRWTTRNRRCILIRTVEIDVW
jgi:hypothetical protein